MDQPLSRLVSIMARLRGPQGCPWDREQTLESLKNYLLEESYEVRQALDEGSPSALREELGDLLFQIVFQCRIAEEKGWFDLNQVARDISDKLVRRHPHVFGEVRLATSRDVVEQWEDLKESERRKNGEVSILANVPRGLPALLRALRLSEKAARVGFDWDETAQVFEKVREEISEWEEATVRGDKRETARELGDLLFSLVNVARRQGIEPETALQDANERFTSRFGQVEAALGKMGKRPQEVTVAELERLWEMAKREEREG